MNREDQIRLSCVRALEKGVVSTSGGWSKEKAATLLDRLAELPKNNLPVSTQPMEVFDLILGILVSLEDAEPRYVPIWAQQLMAG